MLSRLLYSNPVCFLTSPRDTTCTSANVMTISWLTPINNQGGFVMSVNKARFSHQLLTEHGFFTLSIALSSMQETIKVVGSCSGSLVDKGTIPGITFVPPGCFESTATPAIPRTRKQERLHIWDQLKSLKCIQGTAAHLLCIVDRTYDADEHHTLFLSQIQFAFAHKTYWNGTQLISTMLSEPSPVSFLGGGRFAEIR